MKKAALFLTSLVSLSLLLSACQPEDKDLAQTDEMNRCPRCKIKGEGQTKGYPAGSVVAKGPGYFALAAIIVEKEVEAVEMVRLAMGLDDAAAAGYSVEVKRDNGTVTLVSDAKSQQFTTEQGEFTTTVQKTLVASVPVAPTDGVLVSIVAGQFIQSVDRIGQKQNLNWNEDSYNLKLVEGKTADELTLTLATTGKYDSAVGSSPFNLVVTMRLDKASLQSGTVKVLEATNKIAYTYKPGAKESVIELAGTNHEIVNNGSCYTLNSVSTIVTEKTQKKMVYTNSAAEVPGSSYKTSAAACESRPTVDLSRGFAF